MFWRTLVQRSFFRTPVRGFATKLEGHGRSTALAAVPEWTECEDRDAIKRSFTFENFEEAWMFMNGVALRAEKADHHPEWFNVYNRVDVLLSTHDAGGLTSKDIKLAKYMDSVASKFRRGNALCLGI